jgi:pimeloyl-ACP methyl ester carboxylesterase
VNEAEPQFRVIGEGALRRRIAFRRLRPARPDAAGVVWLGGFMSDMASTKSVALQAHCAEKGRACLRFDYSGHGVTGGDFAQCTLTRWLEEACEMTLNESEGPQVIVGSSMGGYLALLLAREMFRRGEAARLKGFVLIAPAIDFTETLLWANLSEEVKRVIESEGFWRRPSAYSPEPYTYTRELIEDGRRHLLFDSEIRSYAPTRILQGMKDPDVPYAHALKLLEHMPSDPVTLSLIRDGDHRLSRPQDILLILEAVERMAVGEE